MLFSASVLFGLFATTFALPAPELVARAQIPASVNCDGAVFDAATIRATISNSRTSRRGANGKWYPDEFRNQGVGNTLVFPNIDLGKTQLWGQPLTNPAWTGGQPGIYRVVVNQNWNYVGVMQHTGGISNAFKPCTVVPNVEPPNVEPPHIEPPNLPGKA